MRPSDTIDPLGRPHFGTLGSKWNSRPSQWNSRRVFHCYSRVFRFRAQVSIEASPGLMKILDEWIRGSAEYLTGNGESFEGNHRVFRSQGASISPRPSSIWIAPAVSISGPCASRRDTAVSCFHSRS